MPVLAIDLGGTKLAVAVFSEDGVLQDEACVPLAKRKGTAVGSLIARQVQHFLQVQKEKRNDITSIGISIPGISYQSKGTVWAPNIPGWDDYPLREELQAIAGDIPVTIDSDRACYILGEKWTGTAKECTDAIFLAVGTGIGAGILINGNILRGAHDIAGCIGWMALERPFKDTYHQCGCFESYASGEGIAKMARTIVSETTAYNGCFKNKPLEDISASDVFLAYEQNDTIAIHILHRCIELWGMAIANLVSLFNPQKIILGGGIFGPAIKFIPAIYEEAVKWGQPVSMKQVIIEASVLGKRAGLYGAGFLALTENKLILPHV